MIRAGTLPPTPAELARLRADRSASRHASEVKPRAGDERPPHEDDASRPEAKGAAPDEA